jgi:hypothetical protein
MTDAALITIAAAIFGVLAFIDVLRANRSLPFTPSPCERDEDRTGDVDAELNGRGLPLRVIDQLNHNGSIY